MLTTKRPTPTTVLYTVSTRDQNPTLAIQATNYGLLLLRLAAGTFILALLLHDLHLQTPLPFLPHPNPLTPLLSSITQHSTPLYRYIISSGIAYLISRKPYAEESLLVIRGLGVQTSTSSSSYLWANTTRFIPTSAIQDFLIHEGFRGFEVRFYLGIVVEGEGEEGVVVVFPNLLPRREILEEVWRGAKACLYEPKV